MRTKTSKINATPLLFIISGRRQSFFYHATNIALKEKGEKRKSWHKICDEAVEKIKLFEDNDELPDDLHPSTWVTGITIMRWFRQFRTNGESFLSIQLRSSQLDKHPPFFYLNPTFKLRFIQYTRDNLAHLTGEVMHDFVHNVLIAELVKEEKEEQEEGIGEKVTKEDV